MAGGVSAMIKVTRPPGPQQLLDPPASDVAIERSEAAKFYTAAVRSKKKFDFKIYKKDYIKSAIEQIFNKKCAYCETLYIVASPVDVEHFRPKSAVKVGKAKRIGYYWLASEWTNLLPSCPRCNRSNTYLMPNKKKETMGKVDFFPLEDETQRAIKPGDEQNEKPLLLNPIDDEPAEHLEFTSDGVVRPVQDVNGQDSPRGKTSIVIYALSRPELIEDRAKRAKIILAHIEQIKFLAGKAKQYPTDGDFKVALRKEYLELKTCLEPDQEYLGMARQITANFFKSIAASLE
jgi:uncharacterized protein (TIGR02646 family)